MSTLVSYAWTVEDTLRFPISTPKLNADGKVKTSSKWKNSGCSPFSTAMTDITNKKFAFTTTNFFYREKYHFDPVEPEIIITGLKSATMEILHEKNDPDVYLRFQTKKTHSQRSGWGDLKTLHIQVSFKSQDQGETEEVWQMVKAFDIPLPNREGWNCSCQKTDLYINIMAKLCHVDVFKDYAIYQTSLICHSFRLELPIQVAVRVSNETVSVPVDPIFHRILNTNPMQFMKKLLSEGLHSDITIHVGDMTFPCHKSILAGQSDVFAAMFDSKMSEANSKGIEITDMSAAGVEALLKYLYNKEVEESVSNCGTALELLKAGHKYQIKDLELESRSILSSMAVDKFDASTAFELFEFCGMVDGFKEGQGKAARVFKENAKKFNETGEFATVLSSANPQVAAKLYELLASL